MQNKTTTRQDGLFCFAVHYITYSSHFPCDLIGQMIKDCILFVSGHEEKPEAYGWTQRDYTQAGGPQLAAGGWEEWTGTMKFKKLNSFLMFLLFLESSQLLFRCHLFSYRSSLITI